MCASVCAYLEQQVTVRQWSIWDCSPAQPTTIALSIETLIQCNTIVTMQRLINWQLTTTTPRPGSRSRKSWAEKHSSRSEPNFSWAEAAKCVSEPKRAKKIRGSFFGEHCPMQNGLSGSSIAPHCLNSLCFVHDNYYNIFPWSRPSILSLSLAAGVRMSLWLRELWCGYGIGLLQYVKLVHVIRRRQRAYGNLCIKQDLW